MTEERILTYEDQTAFKEWIGLNLNSISWEGRYLDDFNQVWELIFEPGIQISDQFSFFSSLNHFLTQGPVISWFKWLRSKLICYLFVNKAYSLGDLSTLAGLDQMELSIILRDFLTDRYSHLEEVINEKFQVNQLLAINSDIKFKDLQDYITDKDSIRGSTEDEVLKDLEVTLYSDWEKLKDSLVKKKNNIYQTEKALANKNKLRQQIRFVRELVILFIIGGILIFSIKIGNKAYEDYLIEKISLFSPQFFWLDKNLSFKNDFAAKKKINIQLDELEKLEQLESKQVFKDINQVTRFEVESDVVLTSVDSLPKDFEVADLEQSNYEEKKKGGYRDSRYGRRRAYRVMMTSVDPDKTREELVKALSKYKVEQVDNVRPGTKIPGGIYFNLYVPRVSLKEFLSHVSSFEREATILESKTRFGGKQNMNKVFIWIKSI